MNNLTHFEIPAESIERAQKFYSGLFDWEFNMMEEMNYLMIQTKDAEGNNSTSGGILEKQNEMHSVTNYINVENIDDVTAKIEELGGKIIVPKTAVPTMGYFVHFMDTEGNILAVWQNDSEAK